MPTFDKEQNRPQEQVSTDLAPSSAPRVGARSPTRSILQLQSTIGNQAVQRLLGQADGPPDWVLSIMGDPEMTLKTALRAAAIGAGLMGPEPKGEEDFLNDLIEASKAEGPAGESGLSSEEAGMLLTLTIRDSNIRNRAVGKAMSMMGADWHAPEGSEAQKKAKELAPGNPQQARSKALNAGVKWVAANREKVKRTMEEAYARYERTKDLKALRVAKAAEEMLSAVGTGWEPYPEAGRERQVREHEVEPPSGARDIPRERLEPSSAVDRERQPREREVEPPSGARDIPRERGLEPSSAVDRYMPPDPTDVYEGAWEGLGSEKTKLNLETLGFPLAWYTTCVTLVNPVAVAAGVDTKKWGPLDMFDKRMKERFKESVGSGAWVPAESKEQPKPGDIIIFVSYLNDSKGDIRKEISRATFQHVGILVEPVVTEGDTELWVTADGGKGSSHKGEDKTGLTVRRYHPEKQQFSPPSQTNLQEAAVGGRYLLGFWSVTRLPMRADTPAQTGAYK